ncbi:hypothetical protein HU200_036259 [Digitaria exilis]|uniref:Uncharacterized protein n=1 Tax=Digitaria exilis TaxID=1010633 RepID=A0A835EHY4_9POAL|nr:hypothetical protein HU200_036259 [Digitaria exilis]
MSVGSKSLPARRVDGEGGENGAVARDEDDDGLRRGGSSRSSRNKKQKASRYDRWFSGRELSSIGSVPLKDVDSKKLKSQIRKWAKAVVAFARQISFGGGSPRSSVATSSSGSDGTPRRSASATFPAASRQASRLGGGAKNEPPVTG